MTRHSSLLVAAAAFVGLAGAAHAQNVPTAQSMGMGVTPMPPVEGRTTTTTRQGAVTPDMLADRRHGARVYYGRSQPRMVEGRVTTTNRMGAVTPDMLADRNFAGRARAFEGPTVYYLGDDDLETATVVTGSTVSLDRGPSRAWKWQQCAKLYPTFDPRTGTFVGEDGLVHLCQ